MRVTQSTFEKKSREGGAWCVGPGSASDIVLCIQSFVNSITRNVTLCFVVIKLRNVSRFKTAGLVVKHYPHAPDVIHFSKYILQEQNDFFLSKEKSNNDSDIITSLWYYRRIIGQNISDSGNTLPWRAARFIKVNRFVICNIILSTINFYFDLRIHVFLFQ